MNLRDVLEAYERDFATQVRGRRRAWQQAVWYAYEVSQMNCAFAFPRDASRKYAWRGYGR